MFSVAVLQVGVGKKKVFKDETLFEHWDTFTLNVWSHLKILVALLEFQRRKEMLQRARKINNCAESVFWS